MKFSIPLINLFPLFLMSLMLPNLQAQNHHPRKVRTNGGAFMHIPRNESKARNTCTRDINRSIDGTCNNLTSPSTAEWGAADIPLYREMIPAYGQPDSYNDMGGQNRISPRAISNSIIAQTGSSPSGKGLSSFVFTWGQFIDHDIDLNPEGHTEYYPIALPEDETDFSTDIPFFRSEVRAGTGESNPRQQSNLITSWIDASNVYGSEITRANWLRAFQNGKLKTSTGNLLPYNTIDGEYGSSIDIIAPSMAATPNTPEKIFIAGDVRANEQPGLTALHTLFVREHNRICNRLTQQGLTNDEEIYQIARKRVGAIIQNITYYEFLPALGIKLPPYRSYKPNIHADIMNLFAAAAYRIGHTMVTEELLLLDNSCNAVDQPLSLIDGFFNPTQIATYGIDPFLQGLAVQTQEEIDVQIIDNLRNFLFAIPGAPFPFGLDLAALNIQRGRDHGLPNYNDIRKYFLGQGARNFGDITRNRTLRTSLQEAYDSPNNTDAWVGLLAEDHLQGTSVGPTLYAILSTQFQKLRDGDYYYFENDPALRGRLLDDIRNVQLANVIERNTTLSNLQNNVFAAMNCEEMSDNNNGPDGNGPGGNNGPDGNGPGGNDGPGGNGPGGNDSQSNNNQGENGPRQGSGFINADTNPPLGLTVFPNPTNGPVTVSIGVKTNASIQIEVIALDGKIYYSKLITNTYADTHEESLNLNIPNGIYFVKVTSDNEVSTQKLFVQREY